MCRMAAWIGPSRSLSSLFFDSEHALSSQAWQPREMLFGNVNVDGTGAAWWPAGERDRSPLRYATVAAPWNDANLPSLAGRLGGEVMIGAVRSATPGIPFGPANVAPFVRGDLALTHNGFVQGFRTGVGRVLTEQLSDDAYGEMDAISDSQTILLLIRTLQAQGQDLVTATRTALERVEKAVRDAGVGAALNLALSDGDRLVVTRASVGLGQNSLYVRVDDGVLLASEPFDDSSQWEPVDEQTLVTATGPDDLTFQPLR